VATDLVNIRSRTVPPKEAQGRKRGHGGCRGEWYRNCLPVTTTTLILARIPSFPWIRGLARRKVPGRRTLVRAAVRVRVRGRRVVSAVRVLITTPRRAILLHRAAGRGSVAGSVIVVVATRAPVSVAVSVPTWAIGTRGRTTTVVLFHRRCVRATAAVGRARSTALATRGDIGLGLKQSHYVRRGFTYEQRDRSILTSAVHATRFPLNSRPSSFSIAVRRSAAVSNSTKLVPCELVARSSAREYTIPGIHIPSTIGFTASFGVHHVEARLARKVFQVLFPEST
jgi:hypothetical protein